MASYKHFECLFTHDMSEEEKLFISKNIPDHITIDHIESIAPIIGDFFCKKMTSLEKASLTVSLLNHHCEFLPTLKKKLDFLYKIIMPKKCNNEDYRGIFMLWSFLGKHPLWKTQEICGWVKRWLSPEMTTADKCFFISSFVVSNYRFSRKMKKIKTAPKLKSYQILKIAEEISFNDFLCWREKLDKLISLKNPRKEFNSIYG